MAVATLGSPLVDGIFLVQKMCIYSCVTLSTTSLIHENIGKYPRGKYIYMI